MARIRTIKSPEFDAKTRGLWATINSEEPDDDEGCPALPVPVRLVRS